MIVIFPGDVRCFPCPIVAGIMHDALLNFCKQQGKGNQLNSIHLVDINLDYIADLKREFKAKNIFECTKEETSPLKGHNGGPSGTRHTYPSKDICYGVQVTEKLPLSLNALEAGPVSSGERKKSPADNVITGEEQIPHVVVASVHAPRLSEPAVASGIAKSKKSTDRELMVGPRAKKGEIAGSIPVSGNTPDAVASLIGAGQDQMWFKSPAKHHIAVYAADITTLDVDAIVSASNEKLINQQGVAAAISKGAGEELQRECWQYINSQNQLRPTQTLVTSSGKLQCRKVIHAVGPVWNNTQKCCDQLKKTFHNCLDEAERQGCQSIAIPAISAGKTHTVTTVV